MAPLSNDKAKVSANKTLLVTGSRNWEDFTRLRNALQPYVDAQWTLLHGDCPTGADYLANRLWREYNLKVERVPADWNKHGKAAGPIRNQQMVDRVPNLCYAFPRGDSRGTWDCLTRAAKAGIKVVIIPSKE